MPQPVRLLELIERARAGNRAHFEVRQLRRRCRRRRPSMVVAARSRSVRARDREPDRQRGALRAARRPLSRSASSRDDERRRDRDRQQRAAGAREPSASGSSAATSRSRRAAQRRARTAGSGCTSASSPSSPRRARSTSSSAASSARCSWFASRSSARHELGRRSVLSLQVATRSAMVLALRRRRPRSRCCSTWKRLPRATALDAVVSRAARAAADGARLLPARRARHRQRARPGLGERSPARRSCSRSPAR